MQSNKRNSCTSYCKVDLYEVSKKIRLKTDCFNLVRIGNSIVYTHGGLSTKNGHLSAHTNNFLEIISDGSAEMRILLHNNDQEDCSVNMLFARILLLAFKDVYTGIMEDLFPQKMVYA